MLHPDVPMDHDPTHPTPELVAALDFFENAGDITDGFKFSTPELEAIRKITREATIKDFSKTLEHEKAIKKLRESNELDDKTGLLKSTVFEKKVRDITQLIPRRANDEDRRHTLILCDLDNFKKINEILSYQGTDKHCLVPAANILVKNLRHGALAGRFGGEEFAVFVPDVDKYIALGIAARIQHEVNTITLPEPVEGRSFLGMSIGITEFAQGTDFTEVFNAANERLNEAKAAGRNQIMVDLDPYKTN